MDMEKLKKALKAGMKVFPVSLSFVGIASASMIYAHMDERRAKAFFEAGIITEQVYRRYWRKSKSNNWLKSHGYPMKRKGH